MEMSDELSNVVESDCVEEVIPTPIQNPRETGFVAYLSVSLPSTRDLTEVERHDLDVEEGLSFDSVLDAKVKRKSLYEHVGSALAWGGVLFLVLAISTGIFKKSDSGGVVAVEAAPKEAEPVKMLAEIDGWTKKGKAEKALEVAKMAFEEHFTDGDEWSAVWEQYLILLNDCGEVSKKMTVAQQVHEKYPDMLVASLYVCEDELEEVETKHSQFEGKEHKDENQDSVRELTIITDHIISRSETALTNIDNTKLNDSTTISS